MTKQRIERVPAASLVEDFDLYPRHKVNPTNVHEIVDAIRGGAELPPVVADRASRRLTDGFHRRRAVLKTLGDDGRIDVLFRDYADEAAMFLDAVALNAHHGQKLANWDRARCIARAKELSIDPDALTAALGITRERLADLELHKTATANAEVVPIKQTVRHLHGRELTEKQHRGMLRSGGMPVGFYVDQVVNAIENDLIDPGNARLAERLRVLAGLLARHAEPERGAAD